MTDVKSKRLSGSETFEAADRLHSAAIHLLRRLRVRDREVGVGPAQLSGRSVLVLGGGPRSLGELAEVEQLRPPTMSRIIAGLVRAGLVRRGKTEDRRRMRLEATAKGTRILQEGRRRRVESLAQALSALSDEDREKLSALIDQLEKVIRHL